MLSNSGGDSGAKDWHSRWPVVAGILSRESEWRSRVSEGSYRQKRSVLRFFSGRRQVHDSKTGHLGAGVHPSPKSPLPVCNSVLRNPGFTVNDSASEAKNNPASRRSRRRSTEDTFQDYLASHFKGREGEGPPRSGDGGARMAWDFFLSSRDQPASFREPSVASICVDGRWSTSDSSPALRPLEGSASSAGYPFGNAHYARSRWYQTSSVDVSGARRQESFGGGKEAGASLSRLGSFMTGHGDAKRFSRDRASAGGRVVRQRGNGENWGHLSQRLHQRFQRKATDSDNGRHLESSSTSTLSHRANKLFAWRPVVETLPPVGMNDADISDIIQKALRISAVQASLSVNMPLVLCVDHFRSIASKRLELDPGSADRWCIEGVGCWMAFQFMDDNLLTVVEKATEQSFKKQLLRKDQFVKKRSSHQQAVIAHGCGDALTLATPGSGCGAPVFPEPDTSMPVDRELQQGMESSSQSTADASRQKRLDQLQRVYRTSRIAPGGARFWDSSGNCWVARRYILFLHCPTGRLLLTRQLGASRQPYFVFKHPPDHSNISSQSRPRRSRIPLIHTRRRKDRRASDISKTFLLEAYHTPVHSVMEEVTTATTSALPRRRSHLQGVSTEHMGSSFVGIGLPATSTTSSLRAEAPVKQLVLGALKSATQLPCALTHNTPNIDAYFGGIQCIGLARSSTEGGVFSRRGQIPGCRTEGGASEVEVSGGLEGRISDQTFLQSFRCAGRLVTTSVSSSGQLGQTGEFSSNSFATADSRCPLHGQYRDMHASGILTRAASVRTGLRPLKSLSHRASSEENTKELQSVAPADNNPENLSPRPSARWRIAKAVRAIAWGLQLQRHRRRSQLNAAGGAHLNLGDDHNTPPFTSTFPMDFEETMVLEFAQDLGILVIAFDEPQMCQEFAGILSLLWNCERPPNCCILRNPTLQN